MRHQRLMKAAASLLLASVVGLSLWLSSPKGVRALTVGFPSLPSSGTLGQTYSFTVTIDVQNGDILPLQRSDLAIINNSNNPILVCNDLPTSNGSKNYTSTETGNGQVSVDASTSGSWPFGNDNRAINWEGSGHQLGGYGYGYGMPGGSITYTIVWTTPSSLTPGSYSVKITVYGDNDTQFSKTSDASFTLAQPSSGGGGFGGSSVGGGSGPTGPGITDVTLYTDSQGVFNMAAQAKSDDGLAWVTINKGTKATQTDTYRVKGISIIPIENTPASNAGATMFSLAYNFGSEGATFTPSITITLSYDPTKLPEGFNARNLVLATWDAAGKKWVPVEGSIVNTDAHTVSAQISHFSAYGIFGNIQPASITMSNLSIAPQEANAGDTVTISTSVANNGDLSGKYTLVLKVNGKQESSQDITLGGNSSTTVKFTISRNQAGKYEVEINGMTTTFTVRPTAGTGGAKFVLKSLLVSPDPVTYGDDILLSVIAMNDGDETTTQTVTFKIDGNIVNAQEVILAPYTGMTVEFTTSTITPGTHAVDVNGQLATFTVKSLVAPITKAYINWWTIGLVILLVTTLTSFIAFSIRSRSRYIPPTPPKAK